MKGAALISVVAALGMRHGVDPDHLSIIDGLSRFPPFALEWCSICNWSRNHRDYPRRRLWQAARRLRCTLYGMDTTSTGRGEPLAIMETQASSASQASTPLSGQPSSARSSLRHGL